MIMSVTRRALSSIVGIAALTSALLATSCATSSEVDQVRTSTKNVPSWIAQGLAMARRSSAEAAERADLPSLPEPPASAGSSLPPEAQFVASVSALGLDPAAASCIYQGIVDTPLADTVGTLLAGATDPLTAATSGAVDEGTQRQLLVALAPCLDTNTLLTVLAAVSGGSGTGGTGGIQSLVGSLAAQLQGGGVAVDPNAVARTAGVNLSPGQVQALAAAIAANGAGALDTSKIDFSKIDVKDLSRDQIIALLAALLRGLTPEQAAQLQQLSAVDIKALNLDIDTSKLSTQQAGALFVLLLPFISAGVAAPTGGPPPGVDPGQIYIPPGTDLSAINPLNFVSKANLIEGLGEQYGISAGQAGCLYEKLRLIDPRLIGEAYLGRSEQGAAQVVLAFVACTVAAG